MNTTDLATRIAAKSDLTVAQAREVVRTLVGDIQAAVKSGEKVTITGFGTFERGSRKARIGRNPYTGEAVKVPAKAVPKFRAGKNFKELLTTKPKKSSLKKKLLSKAKKAAPVKSRRGKAS